MINNCVVSIKKFGGTSTDKKMSSLVTDLRALILPAGTEVLAMYPDLPIGQSFSFVFINDAITSLPPESEITVIDAMGSELTANDVFITNGDTRKNKLAGQIYWSGVCVRKDA